MPVYPSATARLPAGTRTRGERNRGTSNPPVMYANPGANPRNATTCSASACRRPASGPSSRKSGPSYTACNFTVREGARAAAGSGFDSTETSNRSGSNSTSSVRAPGTASRNPSGGSANNAAANASASAFGNSSNTAPSTNARIDHRPLSGRSVPIGDTFRGHLRGTPSGDTLSGDEWKDAAIRPA